MGILNKLLQLIKQRKKKQNEIMVKINSIHQFNNTFAIIFFSCCGLLNGGGVIEYRYNEKKIYSTRVCCCCVVVDVGSD